MNMKPTQRQGEALKLLLDDFDSPIEELMYGGAGGGGKTGLGCLWLLSMAIRYPGTRYFIARRELKDLHNSTWYSLNEFCKLLGILPEWVEYRRLESELRIRNGGTGEASVISMIAAKWEPSDPHYDRFGSYQWTSGWIEESQEVPERAAEVLKTRIGRYRNDEFGIKPRILHTANPTKGYLYRTFYKPWRQQKLEKHMAFVPALHGDNPYLSMNYRFILDNIRDLSTRQRIRDGIWEFGEDGSLIPFDAIQDAFMNIVEPGGMKALSCDAARLGGDYVTMWLWEGRTATLIDNFRKKDTAFTASKLRDYASKHAVPRSWIIVDEDGVGGGVIDQLPGISGFNAQSVPKDDRHVGREQYANLKAQCTYKFADEVNARALRLVVPHGVNADGLHLQEAVVADLEQMKSWKLDTSKHIQVMPKDEVKRALGRSPDFGDGLMMRFALDMPFYRQGAREESVQRVFDKYATL